MQFHRLILLACLLLPVLGCSWITEFAVVNMTGEPVLIHYTLKKWASNESAVEPALAAAGYRRDRSRVGEPRASDVSVSPSWQASDIEATDANTFAVEIPPKSALRLVKVVNYSRPTLDSWERFPIEKLELSSASVGVQLCGPSILVAFEGSRDQQLLLLSRPAGGHTLALCDGVA